MPLLLDASLSPIFITTSVAGVSDDEWRQHYQDLSRQVLQRSQPYAFVVDATDAEGRPSATQRRLQVEWIRANAQTIKTFCRGGAFVLPSPVVRGIVTAIHWLSPPPYPFAIFAKKTEAIAWCRAKLADGANVVGPSGLERA